MEWVNEMSPAQYQLWHLERLPWPIMYTAYLKPDFSGKKTIQGFCEGEFVRHFNMCVKGEMEGKINDCSAYWDLMFVSSTVCVSKWKSIAYCLLAQDTSYLCKCICCIATEKGRTPQPIKKISKEGKRAEIEVRGDTICERSL